MSVILVAVWFVVLVLAMSPASDSQGVSASICVTAADLARAVVAAVGVQLTNELSKKTRSLAAGSSRTLLSSLAVTVNTSQIANTPGSRCKFLEIVRSLPGNHAASFDDTRPGARTRRQQEHEHHNAQRSGFYLKFLLGVLQ